MQPVATEQRREGADLSETHVHSIVSAASIESAVDPVAGSFKELYKRVRLTQGARFIAERRLRRHDRMTQITLTLHAFALIALPVARLAGIKSTFGEAVASAAEILLAVFVLALSLLLSQGNFAVRAENMSRCARQLLSLERDLEVLRRREASEKEYRRASEKYSSILEQSEAHRPIDFDLMRLQRRNEHYDGRDLALMWDYALARIRISALGGRLA